MEGPAPSTAAGGALPDRFKCVTFANRQPRFMFALPGVGIALRIAPLTRSPLQEPPMRSFLRAAAIAAALAGAAAPALAQPAPAGADAVFRATTFSLSAYG